MKKSRLLGAVGACFLSSIFSSALLGATVTFSPTGSLQTWVVPTTGDYYITAIGAQGGTGDSIDNDVGGRGAQIEGVFTLSAGTLLQLVVGEMGESSTATNGGGGGGSFVVDAFDNPLLIAGGGGGIRAYADQDGCDASITEFGVSGSGSSSTSPCTVKTTDLGQGGLVSSVSWGSGGGGFFSDGAADNAFGGDGGSSWFNGSFGGEATAPCADDFVDGGFGGGGTGNGCAGGGGGGGFSGGDGGLIAGGGGSFNAGSNPLAIAGVGYGDGLITISSVPVPAAVWLFGSGLLGLVGMARRKAA